MSYWDQALAARDADLIARCVAAAASEQIKNPAYWVDTRRHQLAAQPGWGDAYASAQAAGREHPGRDASVITDSDILAAIQAIRNEAD